MLEAGSEAIVRLAWSRVLGLPDDALSGADLRVEHVPDPPRSLMTVRLGPTTAVVGPDWFVEAARDLAPDDLARVGTLLALAEGHGGADPLGVGVLAFTDEHVDLPGLDDAEIGDEAALVARLRESCPPADVEESALLELDPAFVLVEDDVPVAGAGYTEWVGLLAHVGVVTATGHRRRGRGLLAAAAATNDALASGLVAQWRARHDNEASLRLARRLGYAELGTQTTVVLREG